MKNTEVARMLGEIADYLEIQGEPYKPRAYRRAARSVESLAEPIESVHERGELAELEGVGESIAGTIADYLESGQSDYYEALKADLPIDIDGITSVPGVGPKTATRLYHALGVTTLEDLERAARAGRIAEVEGFGSKSQQNILAHIDRAMRGRERMLLGRALPVARAVEDRLRSSDAFDTIAVVGSARRRQPTVGDLDILATSSAPEAAMDVFCSHEDVVEVLAKGRTKSSVVVTGGLQQDLRIVAEEEFGAGLVYFTGSKDHNLHLRQLAIDRGLKLNEYGLFDVTGVPAGQSGQRAGERVAGRTEGDVYAGLGLEWVPPELRESTGEIEAAATGELPDLVELDEIRGDLHVHTDESDGVHGVRELAEAAAELGREYLLITDHGPGAPIPQTLDAAAFDEQRAEIDAVNDADDRPVTVLQGIEAEITEDGLGIPDSWAERCDLVVAAMHGRPANPTERVLEAFDSVRVDVLAHPSNRRLNERPPLDLDWEAVMAAAADAGIAMEINAQPERLDLDWSTVKRYRHAVDYVVSTDAHRRGDLTSLHLAVSQARRGWCEPTDVLNTRSLDDLLAAVGG